MKSILLHLAVVVALGALGALQTEAQGAALGTFGPLVGGIATFAVHAIAKYAGNPDPVPTGPPAK